MLVKGATGKWPDLLNSNPDAVSQIPCIPTIIVGAGILAKSWLIVSNIVFNSFGFYVYPVKLKWNKI